MSYDFSGKRVLVTGGAGPGAGSAISLYLSKLGAEVYAIGRTQSSLDNLRAQDPKIKTITCDLSDWGATRKAVQEILPVHFLVNSASSYKIEKFADATKESIEAMFAINVLAPVNLVSVVANDLVKRGLKGAVVNISADIVNEGVGDALSYNMSKSALDQMARCAVAEFSPKGIRFNNINLSIMNTPLTKVFIEADPLRAQEFVRMIPLGRIVDPKEIGPVVAFLLSDQSEMINGHSLPMDGGRLSALIFSCDLK